MSLFKNITKLDNPHIVVSADQYFAMLGVVTGGAMYAIMNSKFFMWLTIIYLVYVVFTLVRDWRKPWTFVDGDTADKIHLDSNL